MTYTQPQSKALFDELAKKLSTNPSEVQQRITAHVRFRTGCATIPNFLGNGHDESTKVAVFKECLAAVTSGDYSALGGSVPQGQVAQSILISTPQPQPAPPPQPTKPKRIEVSGDKVSEAVSAMVTALRGEVRGMVNEELQRLINEK